MWLLDPGWERATDSEKMEQTLKKEFAEFAVGLSDDQSKGRIDIRYKNNAGQHIIVELKRANRVLTIFELAEQGAKYKEGLESCLRKKEGDNYKPNVSIVFVLGREISGTNDLNMVKGILSSINARVVYYQQLIDSSRNSYGEYISRSEKVDSIEAILDGI